LKKLVVQTACLALAFLIGSIFCAFGLATIFAPGRVGVLFDGVGEYSASVFFYEKQYKKTGDVEDLYTLVSKLNVYSDSVRAEKYFTKIIVHDGFDGLCEQLDKDSDGLSTKDYCYGSLCFALAENGKKDQASETVKEIESVSWRTAVIQYIEQKN
jgi:hypothetical protein